MNGTWKLILVTVIVAAGTRGTATPVATATTVRQRLWIWGHPRGVYNESYLRPIKRTSSIEPVDAALHMGIANIIFVRDRQSVGSAAEEHVGPCLV